MSVGPVDFARARIAEDRAVAEACRDWLSTLPDVKADGPGPELFITATAGETGERVVRLGPRFSDADQPLIAFLRRLAIERTLLEIMAASALVEGPRADRKWCLQDLRRCGSVARPTRAASVPVPDLACRALAVVVPRRTS